jgi:hypothetical protein
MRERLPSPALIERQMGHIETGARRILNLASLVRELYDEAYDASLRQASGNGSITPMHRSPTRVDPTGDVATSGMHAAMRSKVRHAAAKLRKLEEPLAEVDRILSEAFAVGEPEHRERMARLRAIEQEQLPRHARKA